MLEDETQTRMTIGGCVAFPKRRLEIDNGDEPVPVYVVNPNKKHKNGSPEQGNNANIRHNR